jgi:hypothetical protein
VGCLIRGEPAKLALLAGDRLAPSDFRCEDSETDARAVSEVDDHVACEPEGNQIEAGLFEELAPRCLSGRLPALDMAADAIPESGPRAATGGDPLQQDSPVAEAEDQGARDELVSAGVKALAVQRHRLSAPSRT